MGTFEMGQRRREKVLRRQRRSKIPVITKEELEIAARAKIYEAIVGPWQYRPSDEDECLAEDAADIDSGIATVMGNKGCIEVSVDQISDPLQKAGIEKAIDFFMSKDPETKICIWRLPDGNYRIW